MRRPLLSAVALCHGVACAPPPLSGTTDPTIRFVFPTSDLEGAVCPSFFVAVAVENWELVEPDPSSDPIDGVGHWHLDDEITGDYYPLVDPYVRAEADLGGETTRLYQLTASLVNVDHSALSAEAFPNAVETIEFEVSSSADCLGEAASDLSAR